MPDATTSLAPTPARMLPVLVIVPAVAAAIRLGRPHYLETQVTAVGFTLLCAVVLGLPALFWALDHGRVRLGSLVALGACAGVMAPIVLVLTGAVGQLQYGGLNYLGFIFKRGAPVPWVGTLAWPKFTGLALASVIAGAVSGVVYWLLIVDRRRSPARRFLLALCFVAAAALTATLLP